MANIDNSLSMIIILKSKYKFARFSNIGKKLYQNVTTFDECIINCAEIDLLYIAENWVKGIKSPKIKLNLLGCEWPVR